MYLPKCSSWLRDEDCGHLCPKTLICHSCLLLILLLSVELLCSPIHGKSVLSQFTMIIKLKVCMNQQVHNYFNSYLERRVLNSHYDKSTQTSLPLTLSYSPITLGVTTSYDQPRPASTTKFSVVFGSLQEVADHCAMVTGDPWWSLGVSGTSLRPNSHREVFDACTKYLSMTSWSQRGSL